MPIDIHPENEPQQMTATDAVNVKCYLERMSALMPDVTSQRVTNRVAAYLAEQATAGIPTGIEAEVCKMIAARQSVGIRKYGQTVAENPLALRAWLHHALEEALDQAIYLRRAIAEIDAILPRRAVTEIDAAAPKA